MTDVLALAVQCAVRAALDRADLSRGTLLIEWVTYSRVEGWQAQIYVYEAMTWAGDLRLHQPLEAVEA